MLNFETWPIERCIGYARNPRKNDHAVDKMASAIREFGFRVPIVAKSDGTVVDGHLRLKAAAKLGLVEVPVILADDLTETQIKAFRLSVNKVSEFAEWDIELLKLEFADLDAAGFDLTLTGFDLGEIAALTLDATEGLTDPDAVPDAPAVPVTVLGDVWLLGRHRLMCGDSTSIDAVERLMNGQKADMVFTDPPYGVSYEGGLSDKGNGLKSNAREMIKNDDVDMYYDVVTISATVCVGPVFMFYADTVPFGLYRGVEAVGGEVVALLIWRKKGGYGAMGASYKPNHEPCLIWKPKGAKLNFIGSTTENRVWDEDKEFSNKLHPTQKPVTIPERAIRNHKADTVLDLFGGSGSTLIACEKTARDCRMMELDPKYCDVIIQRWQNFTGQTATLEATGQNFAELQAERVAS